MVKGTVICNLPDWVPVPTNGSTISIINLVVAVSNVPFGIFAFLSNLAIIVTVVKTPSLQRPSNILLCSLATSDCLVGLVAQPLFVTWWMLIQRVEHYSCLYLQPLTLAALIARMFPTGLSLANLTVVSLDRCYALCRPFAYRAKVTKRGNALSFTRTIFVHCEGKQSKFESSKFIFGSEAERRLIEGYKTVQKKSQEIQAWKRLLFLSFSSQVWISTTGHRPIRLTQCCTQFKSPGVKILCVLYLHYNLAFTFKWYGNSWNKTFYSRRLGTTLS